MFEIKNLKYKEILDIEQLKIDENKVTCIVGKSGSGKSSLLKLLNKINSPDSGTIYYKNQDIEEIDTIKYRRTIPMLAQFPVIYEGNIRDNLLMGLKFSGKDPKDDESLKDALRKVQLDKDLEDDPSDLSGGEKQRLCIARIMLMDTDLILLDEPSSSLDSKTEYKIIKLIYDHIKENNKTMIYVTHSNEVANTFADCLIQMDSGKVINIIDHGGENE